MTPEKWKRVREIMAAALDSPPEQRNEYLDKACASDPDLRREVDFLIAREDEAKRLLDDSALHSFSSSARSLVGK